jgi:hypothetical protein
MEPQTKYMEYGIRVIRVIRAIRVIREIRVNYRGFPQLPVSLEKSRLALSVS